MVILDILEYQLTCNQLIHTQTIPKNLSRARMHSKFIKRLQQTVYSHPITPPSARWISALLHMCRETSLVHATPSTDKFTSISSLNHRTSCSWLKKTELKPEQVNVRIWASGCSEKSIKPNYGILELHNDCEQGVIYSAYPALAPKVSDQSEDSQDHR